ncbi:PREDICTED: aluminum-activated malate transporter 9 [Nelumbo nucifera]|uniref:Aluminum-activated malate transporter 9-like n=2 Tax=Nelumbo nucifera TaxID=4432 RepID=A0A822YGQ4_NELNU|nr:PREDICTED: aluminum-activated malate transporter 9 [Nelumbo nucifera]DAD31750.1 TPA_asm: hypothetical protein HUJ06_010601 [Nelumbo nucifera]
MAVKMGSFKSVFAEKSRERLLSNKGGYSELGFCINDGVDETKGWRWCCSPIEVIVNSWTTLSQSAIKLWEFGRSDPRKAIFAAKGGLALVLITLLIFYREPFKDLGTYSVWAIMTVVVVFEFSVGSTLSKGFNRGLGTLSAGGLAIGMAELSILFGKGEASFIVFSIFIIGFCANFIKMHPTMKPYEYGFRVFLLTYCFIMVSGYKTREFVTTVVNRFMLIVLGAGICLVVTIFIYPLWAGEDLHNLVVKNFMNVAASLEGCVNGYLQCIEYERIPSKILTFQAFDDEVYKGYRSALGSTFQEETLLGFAVWEPPHGPYKMFSYPWKNYVKVSGALRHCAFMVMALHGCILSEIQAPAERRQVFSSELQRVGTEGAKVLRELGNKVKKMERLNPGDILSEVHDAAEELQNKIDRKSYLLVNSESWEIGRRHKVPEDSEEIVGSLDDESKFLSIKSLSEAVLDLRSVEVPKGWDVHNTNMGINTPLLEDDTSENTKIQLSWPSRYSLIGDGMLNNEESRTYESASALSLATFASLLIEFVARLQNLVDSFQELSEKAKFKVPVDPPPNEVIGFWTRFSKCFLFKN